MSNKNKNKLDALVRDNFGKGAARKFRAAGRTPAVVYGHGAAPKHVTMEAHPLSLILRHANALIELNIEGEKEIVLVKDVQRDPVLRIIEHVDLIIIQKGETVEVEVPIIMTGAPFSGMNALQELNTLRMRVPATNIPESIEVSVEGLEAGVHILARDLKLADDETLLDAGDQLIVQITEPRGASAEEEAAEAAAE